jgi:hypothetical protein
VSLLQAFVRKCPATALDTLTTYLTQRSQEYVNTSRDIATHTHGAHARVKHHLSMAQALYTLAEHITQEREAAHGHTSTRHAQDRLTLISSTAQDVVHSSECPQDCCS